jgi:hypothetical protein
MRLRMFALPKPCGATMPHLHFRIHRKIWVVALALLACKSTTTTPPPPGPNAPSNLTATGNSSSLIQLQWTDNSSDEDEFKVERAVGSGAFAEIASLAANSVGYSDAGLSPSIKYSYRVRAVSAAGNSAYAATVSATTDILSESFASNVFSGGVWTRTDSSVAVDVASGVLRISADGGNDDIAQAPINTAFPLKVIIRMRLVSGGQNYRLPQISVGYGASEQAGFYATYLPGSTFGWALGPSAAPFTQQHTNAPSAEGVWMTLTAEIRTNGGDLYAKLDSQQAATLVATASWSPQSQMTILYLKQPWDSVCEFDDVRVRGLSP